MQPRERLLKKRAEAERLRGVPPEISIRAGFELMEFGRDLRAAAEHAKRR